MKDFDDKLGGLLSSLRNRGEFVGELGEAILFEPPTGSIVPSRLLVIGLGPESDLSLDMLRVVGRVSLQEAVRLKAKRLSFAPTIRDHGNNSIDVGQGDRAVVKNVILAYDTEKRLQAQNGVVPYWSSHLDGASSELIVRSGHNVTSDPEAIREVIRILHQDERSFRPSIHASTLFPRNRAPIPHRRKVAAQIGLNNG